MTKPPAETGHYHLTDEHFELEHAELNKLRSQMVAEHAHQLEEFDRQYDRLAQLKADVAYLAERHPAKPGRRKIADVAIPTPAKPKRPTPSRPVPSGKPWTPEEDERLLSDDEDQVQQLASERGVSRYAIVKRRTVLQKKRIQYESPTHPAPIETPAQTEASSSETAEIVEATADAIAKAEAVSPELAPVDKSPTEAGDEPDDGRISPTLQEKLHGYSQTERHPQRHPAIKDDNGFIRPPSMDRLRAGR